MELLEYLRLSGFFLSLCARARALAMQCNRSHERHAVCLPSLHIPESAAQPPAARYAYPPTVASPFGDWFVCVVVTLFIIHTAVTGV